MAEEKTGGDHEVKGRRRIYEGGVYEKYVDKIEKHEDRRAMKPKEPYAYRRKLVDRSRGSIPKPGGLTYERHEEIRSHRERDRNEEYPVGASVKLRKGFVHKTNFRCIQIPDKHPYLLL